jgi:hypothetical protein
MNHSRTRPTALSLALLAMSLLVPAAQAQRSSGFASAPAGRPAGMNAAPGGAARSHLVRVRRGRRNFAGSPYGPNYYPNYYPDYYSNYDSADGMVAGAPPQIIIQRDPSVSPANSPKPPESLVMELRGDHWVRLTGYGPAEPSEKTSAHNSRSLQQSNAALAPVAPPAPLPPAILVFRDGHQEEAVKYTIVGKTISIKTDYWTSGAWSRTVEIASLDLPATLKANQDRGANFRLPSRPGEVMIRP